MVPGTYNPPSGEQKLLTFLGQFSGVPNVVGATFGPAGDKYMYAMVSWSAGSSRSIDAQTIGGVNMTRMLRAVNGASGANMELWKSTAVVPAASGDIVSTPSGSGVTGALALFWGENMSLFGSGVLGVDTSSTSSFAGTARAANGVLLAGSRWGEAGRTTVWTASEGIEELSDSSGFESFAWANPTVAATSTNVFATHSSSSIARRMIVAALN